MTRTSRAVIGGVDTHKDVHVAAVIDEVGKIIDTASFATSAKGCAELSAWMRAHGELVRVGVEGTGCDGAGLARLLEEEGVEVVEVNRPNRQARRRRGKSDTVDAEAAARAALNGEVTVAPKTKGGAVESIRVLRVAFTSARRARTQVALQIRISSSPPPTSCERCSLRCRPPSGWLAVRAFVSAQTPPSRSRQPAWLSARSLVATRR